MPMTRKSLTLPRQEVATFCAKCLQMPPVLGVFTTREVVLVPFPLGAAATFLLARVGSPFCQQTHHLKHTDLIMALCC